jgi:protein TonB
MPQVAEPPRPPAPASEAVVAVPPAATVERETPAPISAPAPAPAARSTSPATTESPSAVFAAPTVTARVAPGAADPSHIKAGAKTSTAGNGAGGSSDAEYRAYLGLVRQRILEALRYPPAARQQGLIGTVHLEIVVQPTGAISDVTIVSPSAHPVLDQAALEAVRNLSSVRFPAGLTPRQLRARLPVMFNLR